MTTCKNYLKMKTILLLLTIIGVNFPLTYQSWVLIKATFFFSPYIQTFVDTLTSGNEVVTYHFYGVSLTWLTLFVQIQGQIATQKAFVWPNMLSNTIHFTEFVLYNQDFLVIQICNKKKTVLNLIVREGLKNWQIIHFL